MRVCACACACACVRVRVQKQLRKRRSNKAAAQRRVEENEQSTPSALPDAFDDDGATDDGSSMLYSGDEMGSDGG